MQAVPRANGSNVLRRERFAGADVLDHKERAAEVPAWELPRPAWVHGCAIRNEPPVSPLHDSVDPAAGRDCAQAVYQQAGIANPAKELDVAELFVPYSWMGPSVMENVGLAFTDGILAAGFV